MHAHKRTHSTDGFWTWRRNVAARCCGIYVAMVARVRTCSYLCTNPGIEHARTDHINPLRDCIVIRHPRICPPPPHSTIAYARQSVGDGVMHATATTCYWVAVGCGDMHGHPIALRGWHGLGWGATENTHLHRSQCGRHVHIAGPAAPFPPSIFLDKNRRDIGQSQSICTDSKMETAGSQHAACPPLGGLLFRFRPKPTPRVQAFGRSHACGHSLGLHRSQPHALITSATRRMPAGDDGARHTRSGWLASCWQRAVCSCTRWRTTAWGMSLWAPAPGSPGSCPK
jgi:hypothetical protein